MSAGELFVMLLNYYYFKSIYFCTANFILNYYSLIQECWAR